MDYHELIHYKDVEYNGLIEPNANSLRVFFARCKVSETPENLNIGKFEFKDIFPIEINDKLPILQIDFESYIAYSITNESFTTWDNYEIFEGKAFRKYSKSRYLDFIKSTTIANVDYPGYLNHYGFVCLNHIVDIITSTQIVITEINEIIKWLNSNIVIKLNLLTFF